MRILPGLQSLINASPTSAPPSTPKGKAAASLEKATTLSFVDTASIAVEAVERAPAKPVPTTLRAKVLAVFRPKRNAEDILFAAHKLGAHGRVATYHALTVDKAREAGAVACGHARVRIIPAKAVDFGFTKATTRRK